MGGWTPLHLAAMNGHVNVAVALMWGNKEHMLNGADNSAGLATMTGDGSETVSVLVLFCDGSRGVPWRLQLPIHVPLHLRLPLCLPHSLPLPPDSPTPPTMLGSQLGLQLGLRYC